MQVLLTCSLKPLKLDVQNSYCWQKYISKSKRREFLFLAHPVHCFHSLPPSSPPRHPQDGMYAIRRRVQMVDTCLMAWHVPHTWTPNNATETRMDVHSTVVIECWKGMTLIMKCLTVDLELFILIDVWQGYLGFEKNCRRMMHYQNHGSGFAAAMQSFSRDPRRQLWSFRCIRINFVISWFRFTFFQISNCKDIDHDDEWEIRKTYQDWMAACKLGTMLPL